MQDMTRSALENHLKLNRYVVLSVVPVRRNGAVSKCCKASLQRRACNGTQCPECGRFCVALRADYSTPIGPSPDE